MDSSSTVYKIFPFYLYTARVCVCLLDLNECTAKPGTCKNGRCENTVGSYRCRCDQGFVANPTQTECIGTYHILYILVLLFTVWFLDLS